MWVKIIKESIAVLLISLILAGAGYALRPVFFPQSGASQNKDGTMADDGTLSEISLEEALVHFKKGDALYVDARPEKAYTKGHIKGAINLDPNEIDTWSGDFFSRISPDQVIIAYCEGTQCRLSLELAEKLTWMGYEKVFYLKNGWGLWKEKKLPSQQLSE